MDTRFQRIAKEEMTFQNDMNLIDNLNTRFSARHVSHTTSSLSIKQHIKTIAFKKYNSPISQVSKRKTFASGGSIPKFLLASEFGLDCGRRAQ